MIMKYHFFEDFFKILKSKTKIITIRIVQASLLALGTCLLIFVKFKCIKFNAFFYIIKFSNK